MVVLSAPAAGQGPVGSVIPKMILLVVILLICIAGAAAGAYTVFVHREDIKTEVAEASEGRLHRPTLLLAFAFLGVGVVTILTWSDSPPAGWFARLAVFVAVGVALKARRK